MPKIGFEAPGTIRELLDLLNRSGKWEFTFVDMTGRVHGFYQSELFQTRVAASLGRALIYNGQSDDPDAHPVFTAESDEDALCFLYGLYFGMFEGKELEAVQDDLNRHRNERPF